MKWWLLLFAGLAACDRPDIAHAQSETCGTCHQAQFASWSRSQHAVSQTSPVFQALLPKVSAQWGTVARARCESCHSPQHADPVNIGCVSCHAATGNRQEANGALIVDIAAPISTTRHRPESPHGTQVRTFLSSSELCGTCHEVQGPGLIDEPTLSEHRTAAPAADQTCQSCHATDGHAIRGIDPAWGASAEVALAARQSALELLQRALTLEISSERGRSAVRLRNTGATHDVPTGATALRDVWVDVVAVDTNGQRHELRRVIELGARLTGPSGDVALITDAITVENRSLPFQQERVWPLPSSMQLVSVEATLKARAIRLETLEALGLSQRAAEVPELIVATVTTR